MKQEEKPKMPRFNMNWIYTLVIIALALLFITDSGDALASGSSKEKGTYTDFKTYVAKGYASKVIINKSENTLQMYVKAKHSRDVFKKSAQQLGKEPYLSVEFGSVDELERFLTEQTQQGKLKNFSYENK